MHKPHLDHTTFCTSLGDNDLVISVSCGSAPVPSQPSKSSPASPLMINDYTFSLDAFPQNVINHKVFTVNGLLEITHLIQVAIWGHNTFLRFANCNLPFSLRGMLDFVNDAKLT